MPAYAGMTCRYLRVALLATSYHYNTSEVAGSDSPNSGERFDGATPRHLFKLWSTWNPPTVPALTVGGGMRAQDESLFLRFRDGKGGQSFEQPKAGYALFDALVAWQIDPHWKASLNAHNLLERVHYISANSNGEFGVTYGTPRSFTLSLRGAF